MQKELKGCQDAGFIREGSALLSVPSSEGGAVLFALTASTKGREILKENSGLVEKITEVRLNQVVAVKGYEGQSVLFQLAGTPEGREILQNNKGLVEKITEVGLNQVVTAKGV